MYKKQNYVTVLSRSKIAITCRLEAERFLERKELVYLAIFVTISMWLFQYRHGHW